MTDFTKDELARIDGLTITLRDIFRCGHCVVSTLPDGTKIGIKPWLEKHGFDFRHVRDHGISAKAVVATGDALGIRVVRLVLARG